MRGGERSYGTVGVGRVNLTVWPIVSPFLSLISETKVLDLSGGKVVTTDPPRTNTATGTSRFSLETKIRVPTLVDRSSKNPRFSFSRDVIFPHRQSPFPSLILSPTTVVCPTPTWDNYSPFVESRSVPFCLGRNWSLRLCQHRVEYLFHNLVPHLSWRTHRAVDLLPSLTYWPKHSPFTLSPPSLTLSVCLPPSLSL